MKNKEKYNLSELSITIENGSVIINNINKKFNGLKEYCEWLEEEEEKNWKPKEGETYYLICEDLRVGQARNKGNDYDYVRIIKRNTYRTGEEAEKALEMYEFCKERSFEPNWNDENETKYHLWLDYRNKKICHYLTMMQQEFAPFYYPNKKVVYEIINKYSFEDLEKYYGRV